MLIPRSASSAPLGRQSSPDPGNPHHALDRSQLTDDASQVDAVVHADYQLDDADAAVALVHADLLDVAVCGIDATGQQGDQAALVLELDAQLDVEFAGDVLGPGKLDALVRVVADFGDVPAGIQVHHHALAGGQVTHDGVAGDRRAALGVVEHQALGAADRQRSFGGRRLFAVAGQQ